jgi:type I restriction enzyme S subunit
MNETLESMARTIFKSWFVDFDPVWAKAEGRAPAGMDAQTAALFPDSFKETELGMVPKGWDIKSLDEIAEFLNGLAMQKFPLEGEDFLPVIKIAELHRGNTIDSDRASPNIDPIYIVEDGDILFSWSGSLEVCIWCGGKGALN